MRCLPVDGLRVVSLVTNIIILFIYFHIFLLVGGGKGKG